MQFREALSRGLTAGRNDAHVMLGQYHTASEMLAVAAKYLDGVSSYANDPDDRMAFTVAYRESFMAGTLAMLKLVVDSSDIPDSLPADFA